MTLTGIVEPALGQVDSGVHNNWHCDIPQLAWSNSEIDSVELSSILIGGTATLITVQDSVSSYSMELRDSSETLTLTGETCDRMVAFHHENESLFIQLSSAENPFELTKVDYDNCRYIKIIASPQQMTVFDCKYDIRDACSFRRYVNGRLVLQEEYLPIGFARTELGSNQLQYSPEINAVLRRTGYVKSDGSMYFVEEENQ